ncbi:hypothetical protein BDZ97DRAFT_250746 [Flammula alnicola]|nr:hypothetical protein BDZ97DRAFT_250746 [Flammula alnicola]
MGMRVMMIAVKRVRVGGVRRRRRRKRGRLLRGWVRRERRGRARRRRGRRRGCWRICGVCGRMVSGFDLEIPFLFWLGGGFSLECACWRWLVGFLGWAFALVRFRILDAYRTPRPFGHRASWCSCYPAFAFACGL